MDSKGRRFHQQVAELREKGDSIRSLQLSEEAMQAYQEADDSLGFAEILADRSITLRHLYEQTSNKNYLILAKHEIMASVEIARVSGQKDALAIPLFNLGKVQKELGEHSEAAATFKEAVENMADNPPKMHYRPSVLADMRVHQAVCEYMAGDKLALERAEKALVELEGADEVSKYNKDVWTSGGHMHMAEMLKQDKPEKAREHLQRAKDIIDKNPELTLRKKQWEKLAKELGV